MDLTSLTASLKGARLIGDGGVIISDITADSREVAPGTLFVAVRGMTVDGHDYISTAIDRGAAALVVEREVDADLPQVVVKQSSRALGRLVATLCGRPSDRLTTVGITGTNGKTTTSYLVEAVLTAAGKTLGVIGTVSYRIAGSDEPAPYTTPTPKLLHETLGRMVDAGCDHAVLEVSSAALSMDRLAGLAFDVGVFTNLTQDHLDVHQTMEAYRDAKTRLFHDHLDSGGVAVVNVDDPAGGWMAEAASGRRVVRVSTNPAAKAEVRVLEQTSTINGIVAKIETPRGILSVESHALLGAYNVSNIAVAVAVGEALALEHDDVARGIASMAGVPGRVERVINENGLDILVDYAHTPDALANVLAALRPLTRKRLICVFGCGGDRDPSKRPKMGAEVHRLADLAVVTSDNPRTEVPADIIEMILPAVPDPFFVDADRRIAIRAAIAEATPGDIVLIAGKGHEDYQILGTEKIHFDDREEAAAAAAARWTFPVGAVATACGGSVVAGPTSGEFARVIINGRIAAPGDLYVAIEGERFDGHDFIGQAAASGATGAVVRRGWDGPRPDRMTIIEADDPRAALGAVARFHRRRWAETGDKHLIAVTGSAGKTTVKDLIAAAVSNKARAHRTSGSLNNETGVPLTLLGLRPFHDIAIIEMGMRGLGQITYLAEFAEPDVGVITNAGVAHIGVVGSIENIAKGKGELFAHLAGDGTAIYPANDRRLAGYAGAADARRSFGGLGDTESDVHAIAYALDEHGRAQITLRCANQERSVSLALAGRHNATNAACAVAAAMAAGVAFDDAVDGLSRARPPHLRGERVTVAGRHVLIDCYNANPASMAVALETLADLKAGANAVAVLGDMLELGDTAADEHEALGALAAELGIPVVTLGDYAGDVTRGVISKGGNVTAVQDPENAARVAHAVTRDGGWILVKASRGMRLERVVEALKEMDS